MDVATTSPIERIARVLAAQHASVNAEGDEASASASVEARYPDYFTDALAVLKTLREPSDAMARAGDPAVWERMVRAAIEEAEADSITP